MRKGFQLVAVPSLVCAAWLVSGCGTPDPPLEPSPRLKVLETTPLHIDRIYTSMEGPSDRLALDVSDLDWVTAFRTEVVSVEDGSAVGDEFFCHSQLQLWNTTRLLVTATGLEELRFPDGFAMPVSQIVAGLPQEQRATSLLGMVLNNFVPGIDEWVRVRWSIEYFRDEEVGRPPRLKRLYKVGLPMTVEDIEAYEAPAGVGEQDDDAANRCVLVGGLTGHWLVPPGEQITRKTYSDFMPVDGTVHYASVHLHNHGRSMRLIDKTTGETLWETEVLYESDRTQIREIPVYSSAEGFPILRDHVYEIEARYDNTTDHDVDAMASMYLYYHPANDEMITYPNAPVDDRPADF